MSLDLKSPANPTASETSSYRSNGERKPKSALVWQWVWPKALAIGLVLLAWQIAIWTEWKPPYVLPSPAEVFSRLWDEMLGNSVTDKTLWDQLALTMKRGATASVQGPSGPVGGRSGQPIRCAAPA